MRIDFQQGEHLRVGHVLVTWHPDVSHHRPGLHEVGMGETRADARKVERVARLAEDVVGDSIDRHNADARSIYGCDLVDTALLNKLGEAVTDWHLSVETERFGGVAVPVRGRLLCVGWKDARPPRVEWLRPREAKRRLRHTLRRWLGIIDLDRQAMAHGGDMAATAVGGPRP
jgi:hypothetical protein